MIVHRDLDGDCFTSQRRLVDRASALDDHAVNRQVLAGAHTNDLADRDLAQRDLAVLAVFDEPCDIGCQPDELFDGALGAARGARHKLIRDKQNKRERTRDGVHLAHQSRQNRKRRQRVGADPLPSDLADGRTKERGRQEHRANERRDLCDQLWQQPQDIAQERQQHQRATDKNEQNFALARDLGCGGFERLRCGLRLVHLGWVGGLQLRHAGRPLLARAKARGHLVCI